MKFFYTKIYHTKVSLHENFQIYGTCNSHKKISHIKLSLYGNIHVPDVLVAPLWISVCDSLSQLQHAALSMPPSGEEVQCHVLHARLATNMKGQEP